MNSNIKNLSNDTEKTFNDTQEENNEIIDDNNNENNNNNNNNNNNILNKEIEIINNNINNNNNSENSTEIDNSTASNGDNISEIDSTPSSPCVFSSSSASSSFSNLGSCISTSTSSSTNNLISSTNSLQQQIQRQTKPKKIIEGELIKRGHIFPSWRTRWFRIENGFLLYFKSKNEPEPIDRVPLRGSRVSKKPFHDRPNTFELIATTKMKIFLLQAKDVDELDFWMDEIIKETEFARSLYSRTVS
ncbi:hypothetical protein DDB_G0283415 [Dictyostelium discoideum AX4]|uniref:PH domain-containing protein n=1 Tax=Dictyostelium discoideum TaxID=44689 RepID=Q54R43_DICDI|nr:hypothetical protein DDB_G0283415 [Dictyostelium discoideum AX4]EAL65692.1 hypothetical protein DDB_G0283415 [Dictyostelium discoideum AX4]|eukprot:XP_639048.1 hypothetical protein DDB_G0283415 [Dictyostelium discoideum AX4]